MLSHRKISFVTTQYIFEATLLGFMQLCHKINFPSRVLPRCKGTEIKSHQERFIREC